MRRPTPARSTMFGPRRCSAASARAARLLRHGARRRLDGLRRRFLPGGRRRGARRPDKVDYVPLSAADRFDALTAAQDRSPVAQQHLDDVARPRLGIDFAGVSYYDGQGFLVARPRRLHQRAPARRRAHLRDHGHHHRGRTPPPGSRRRHMKVSFMPFPRATRRGPPMPRTNATCSPPTARRSPPNARCCRSRTTTSSCRRSSPRNRSAR